MPAAADPALSVSVDEPPDVTEAGLNDAEAPAGRPVADNETVCAEPDVVAVLMVDVPEPPAETDTVDGEAAIEKSFATTGVIVNVTLAVCVALAPVPVTVRA